MRPHNTINEIFNGHLAVMISLALAIAGSFTGLAAAAGRPGLASLFGFIAIVLITLTYLISRR